MSRPWKRRRPASGVISPASWPIKVVFPAPFGPMTACSSPSGIASEIASEAITPPKCFESSSICSSASATRSTRNETIDSAAREQHDQEEDGPENDLPVLDNGGEPLLQQQQRDGADN